MQTRGEPMMKAFRLCMFSGATQMHRANSGHLLQANKTSVTSHLTVTVSSLTSVLVAGV